MTVKTSDMIYCVQRSLDSGFQVYIFLRSIGNIQAKNAGIEIFGNFAKAKHCLQQEI
jgi:hypothetical protein